MVGSVRLITLLQMVFCVHAAWYMGWSSKFNDPGHTTLNGMQSSASLVILLQMVF
jgi:hypothetical protein